MAHTFSNSANEFIDKNVKTKTNKMLMEYAVNMAVQDVLRAVTDTLIELCPHKCICSKQFGRGGCDCSYMNLYINKIKESDNLFFNIRDKMKI